MSPLRTMAAAVLSLEAVVLFLTTPVMIQVEGVDATAALLAGLGLAVLAVATAGLLRFGWAYGVGSLLQVGAVALGFVVPLMFVLGLLFAAFWALALMLGRRVERLRAERGTP
ncbi:MAG: DUF4233 domain-containing protein [Actinomycetota bacterium]|nr:DUF4233 domain-containing protein [Actinomycetota bacterium]